MTDTALNLFTNKTRSEWVRLRTLVNLRWLAIFGQVLAVLFSQFLLDLDFDLGLIGLAVGTSVVFNLVAIFILPENKRLSARDATLTLLFDLAQLSFLLFLTGGLSNPFALLILGPVMISASVLTLRATVFLGLAAVLMITLLTVFNIPLRTSDGWVLEQPDLFVGGTWIALIVGMLFLGGYARRVSVESFSMSQALMATQMALGREHELTMLGGVIAAAAHELGTPLATIKLVSAELSEELENNPDLKQDAQLIHEQASRCHQILRDMGRSGKEDLLMRTAPLTTVLHEAAEPHESRGKTILYRVNGQEEASLNSETPIVSRNPEIIHGLRNLVQNAVDFAATNVWINVTWNTDDIKIVVSDDGRGYPPDLLGRIGDPFIRKRSSADEGETKRPGYEGMGLGLFIAKTLLERTGAEVTFTNALFDGMTSSIKATGAIVEVTWNRTAIEHLQKDVRGPLGPNQPIN